MNFGSHEFRLWDWGAASSGATPLGLAIFCGRGPQGNAPHPSATLGWRTQSLWDWRCAQGAASPGAARDEVSMTIPTLSHLRLMMLKELHRALVFFRSGAGFEGAQV